MQPSDIRIGTSGWKFDDWAGTFYPLRVPQTKWLEYYAARFPVGEINSTYYRIAPAAAWAGVDRKTPAGFEFFAKVHSNVTHTREEPETAMRELLNALQPLRESGKLTGLLAQFPNAFHYSAENAAYLERVREQCDDIRLCVEMRHHSWADGEALARVRKAGLTWVSVDEPELPELMPRGLTATSDILYLRLHGRNAAAWYDRRAGDRYDYNYSAEELAVYGRQLLESGPEVSRAYVLFNNCYHGQAPGNAAWLQSWLGSGTTTAGPSGSDELTLSAD